MSTPPEREPPRAESFDAYRWAHLLVVASAYGESGRRAPLTLDRLATYDFFAAHPFLVFDAATNEGRQLVREGLEPKSLTYAAAPDRLANRRQRIQADVTALVARDLARIDARDGRLVFTATPTGLELTARFTSLFAQAIRLSAELVIIQLDRLSDRALRARATDWTSHRALMVDILESR